MAVVNKYNYQQMFGLDYLKPITKAVIDCILKYANENGVAFPSQETVAKELNIHRRTVQRHIKIIADIKIADNMPFMKIEKKRDKKGKWLHNVYIFPWLKLPNDYLRSHQKWIIDKLIEEYYEMYLEEIQNSHTHATMKSINKKRQKSLFSLKQVAKIVNSLSKILKISTHKVIETLICIGYELTNNGCIYYLDRYLISAFRKAGVNGRIEETIKKIYQSLGITGTDIHCINYKSLAHDLMSL